MLKAVSIKHKHRKEALHSPAQQAMFFALADQLGYDENEVKERAKKKFKHGCFNDITSSEINYLIEKLTDKVEGRE